MRTLMQKAQKNIEAFFDTLETNVFLKKDIHDILMNKRAQWHLPVSLKLDDFVSYLTNVSKLKEIGLVSPNYDKTYTRFAWMNVSPYQVSLSLRSRSYLSHHTAIYLHGLIKTAPRTIYVNSEQSSKIREETGLEQKMIDMAFRSKSRISKYIFTYDNWKIYCLSGLNTNNLGVEEIEKSKGEKLHVTNIERTLIDIAVRPFYSGGTSEVQKAYIKAKRKTSVDTLVSILKKINYIYPYHQAIGFYMQRAGFGDSALNLLKTLGLKYDFYLDYGMKERNYSREWRIYFPKDIPDPTKP